MNKAKVIGLTVTVLAVVGGVAVFNWVRKPKKNADGFFNADGTRLPSSSVRANCGRRNADGSVSYYTEAFGQGCRSGYKQVRYFGDRTGL